MKKRIISSAGSNAIFQTSLLAVVIGFGLYFDHAASVLGPTMDAPAAPRANVSQDVRRIAQWAIDSRDHAGLPFVVIDKARARLFAFDPAGRLKGSAPVLLGASRGDGPAVPGTPAGRFVADTGLSARVDGIVWVNAGTALSLHSMPSTRSPGRGAQRLASRDPEDKRISDGSLHVAGEFYREHLGALRHQASVAYVLPESSRAPRSPS